MLEEMLDTQFLYNDNSRYVVLLRDPLAAKSSALARFQANPTGAALELEANVSVTAHRLLAKLVAQLPCERTLFLGYEALVALPLLHVGALAAFLGVSPKDERLSEWLGSLTPCPTCAHMARQYSKNGTLPGEAVPCESIPEENLAFGERLLKVDAPLRLQPPCANKSACEAQVFDFFAAEP